MLKWPIHLTHLSILWSAEMLRPRKSHPLPHLPGQSAKVAMQIAKHSWTLLPSSELSFDLWVTYARPIAADWIRSGIKKRCKMERSRLAYIRRWWMNCVTKYGVHVHRMHIAANTTPPEVRFNVKPSSLSWIRTNQGDGKTVSRILLSRVDVTVTNWKDCTCWVCQLNLSDNVNGTQNSNNQSITISNGRRQQHDGRSVGATFCWEQDSATGVLLPTAQNSGS